MNLPFEQQRTDSGRILRTFSPEVESDELKWHQDFKDRKVIVIESGGWSFQTDDGLPSKLVDAEQILIPKFVWHRVIKGESKLVVEIEEFD